MRKRRPSVAVVCIARSTSNEVSEELVFCTIRYEVLEKYGIRISRSKNTVCG